MAACGSATTASPSPTTAPRATASLPRGWRTYIYGAAAISVPNSWVARHDNNCPDTLAAGTLELGVPRVLINCTLIVGSPPTVTVSALTAGISYASPCLSSLEVNGLTAYGADCAASPAVGPSTSTTWTVPSLDIEVSGSGDTASQSLVNLILHTLRRATPQEITDSQPLGLDITLDHTRVVAGTPIKGTAIFTNRTTSPITVETCAADGWLDVGLENRAISYQPANPAIACAPTVTLAPGVTRIPFPVLTTYEGCSQSPPAGTEYPPCIASDLPPLPAGTYRTTVITAGLPAGTPAPGQIAVTLTPAP